MGGKKESDSSSSSFSLLCDDTQDRFRRFKPPIDSSIAEEEQEQQQQQAQAQVFTDLPNPLLKIDVHSLVK